MDRRLLLPLMLVLGCAEGSLEGPGSFGLPNTSTMTTQADTEEDDDDGETEDDDETDDGDGDGDGDTGPSTQSSTDPSTDTAQDESSSAPITTAEDSSEDDSASASAEESSSSDPSASASDDAASMDDGVEPPPDAAAWDNCEAAVCEVGNDCITVTGVVGEAYCAPQCVDDFDCPFPDTGDATPFCLLVGEDAVEPTNCALVCELDGLDYGACPDGMSCTSVPGQDPSISLCMW